MKCRTIETNIKHNLIANLFISKYKVIVRAKINFSDDEKLGSLQDDMEKINLNQDLESIEVVDDEAPDMEKTVKQKRELNRSDSKRKLRKRGKIQSFLKSRFLFFF